MTITAVQQSLNSYYPCSGRHKTSGCLSLVDVNTQFRPYARFQSQTLCGWIHIERSQKPDRIELDTLIDVVSSTMSVNLSDDCEEKGCKRGLRKRRTSDSPYILSSVQPDLTSLRVLRLPRVFAAASQAPQKVQRSSPQQRHY